MDVYHVMKITVASGKVIRAQHVYVGSLLFSPSDTVGGLFVFVFSPRLFQLSLILTWTVCSFTVRSSGLVQNLQNTTIVLCSPIIRSSHAAFIFLRPKPKPFALVYKDCRNKLLRLWICGVLRVHYKAVFLAEPTHVDINPFVCSPLFSKKDAKSYPFCWGRY